MATHVQTTRPALEPDTLASTAASEESGPPSTRGSLR